MGDRGWVRKVLCAIPIRKGGSRSSACCQGSVLPGILGATADHYGVTAGEVARCLFVTCTGVQTSMSHRGEGGCGCEFAGVLGCVAGGVSTPHPVRGADSGQRGCVKSASSHPHNDSLSRIGGSSSSSWWGRIEMWPNISGDLRRPTSVRWSALLFPLKPMCEGMWSHLISSPSWSVRSRICVHKSTCFTSPAMLHHLCLRHLCAQPNTPDHQQQIRADEGPVICLVSLQIGVPADCATLRADPHSCWFGPHLQGWLSAVSLIGPMVSEKHSMTSHPPHLRVLFR